MNIDQLLDELYSYSMHGIKLGLENIEKICKELGNPEKSYKIIHIAGTNGKGSNSFLKFLKMGMKAKYIQQPQTH